MTVLALRLAARSNGVSMLHGGSRGGCGAALPGLPRTRCRSAASPTASTCGPGSAPEMRRLYESHMGRRMVRRARGDRAHLGGGSRSPRANSGTARAASRRGWSTWSARGCMAQLDAPERRPGRGQPRGRGAGPEGADDRLRPAFRRRTSGPRCCCATRAADRLVNDPERPVQFIFAGKAHPQDDGGKELIRQLSIVTPRRSCAAGSCSSRTTTSSVARRLVQGVDVWLNTPRRPLEASGTSGMKAVRQRRAARRHARRLVGRGRTGPGSAGRSATAAPTTTRTTRTSWRALSLYDLLEREIVPIFYERDAAGLPQSWITRMRASMGGLTPVFTTDRMVHEYLTRFYEPAARDFDC